MNALTCARPSWAVDRGLTQATIEQETLIFMLKRHVEATVGVESNLAKSTPCSHTVLRAVL